MISIFQIIFFIQLNSLSLLIKHTIARNEQTSMNQTPLKDAMNSSCESVSIVLTKKHDGGLPMKKLILYSSSKNRVDAFSHYSNREIRMTVLLGCHEGSLPPPIVRNQGTISHIEPSSMDGDKCPSSLSRNKNLFRVASTNCGDGANERQVVVAP